MMNSGTIHVGRLAWMGHTVGVCKHVFPLRNLSLQFHVVSLKATIPTFVGRSVKKQRIHASARQIRLASS